MPPHEILSPSTFKTRTSASGFLKKNFKGRWLKLQAIDHGLEEYDLARRSRRVPAQCEWLYAVTKACHRWQEHKVHKKATALSGQRRVAIMLLGSEALRELKKLSPALAAFESRKTAHGKLNVPHRPLQGGYAQERRAYLDGAKATHPATGSGVRDKLDDIKQDGKKADPALWGVLSKTFATLTNAEFDLIAKTIGTNGEVSHVTFLNKLARMEFLVIPDPSPFSPPKKSLIDANSQTPHDNQDTNVGGASAPETYAMDSYGNLFVKNAGGLAGGYWNHSSFNAGNPVVCAGMILIRQGRLDHIDSASGHYQPDAAALRAAVKHLRNEGVDITNTRVEIHGTGSYRAQTFLAGGGPDWTPAMTTANNLF
jgi:hypothetical protein